VRLHYLDADLNGLNEATLKLYRREGGGTWVEVPVMARNTTENWLEAAAVTEFSEWTAGNNTPTAVRVRVFRARSGS
jgi:hypothetical protein